MTVWIRRRKPTPDRRFRGATVPATPSLPGQVSRSAFDPDRARRIEHSDPLRRARWIDVFERQLELIPVAHSFVFSLEGPWGSGKTSVLDTIEHDPSMITQNRPLMIVQHPL